MMEHFWCMVLRKVKNTSKIQEGLWNLLLKMFCICVDTDSNQIKKLLEHSLNYLKCSNRVLKSILSACVMFFTLMYDFQIFKEKPNGPYLMVCL